MMKNNVLLIGFKHAVSIHDIVEQIQETGKSCLIVSPDDFLLDTFDTENSSVMVAVFGNLELRKLIINKIDTKKIKRFTFIHPTCVVSSTATIKPGTFVGPYSMIPNNAVVEEDCMIGPYCTVNHSAKLGKSCIMNTGAFVLGSSTIGDRCVLSARSTIIDKITICDDVMIGAGAIVTKDITEPGFYLGSPARRRINVE